VGLTGLGGRRWDCGRFAERLRGTHRVESHGDEYQDQVSTWMKDQAVGRGGRSLGVPLEKMEKSRLFVVRIVEDRSVEYIMNV
jgi:hypothetical protein